MAGHEILAEGLRALQLRGLCARAEAAQASIGEAVDDTGYKRRLGADDREVDGFLAREPKECINILGADVAILDAGLERGAGIARSDEHLVDAR